MLNWLYSIPWWGFCVAIAAGLMLAFYVIPRLIGGKG